MGLILSLHLDFRASKYRSIKNGQLGSDVHMMIIKTSRGGVSSFSFSHIYTCSSLSAFVAVVDMSARVLI